MKLQNSHEKMVFNYDSANNLPIRYFFLAISYFSPLTLLSTSSEIAACSLQRWLNSSGLTHANKVPHNS